MLAERAECGGPGFSSKDETSETAVFPEKQSNGGTAELERDSWDGGQLKCGRGGREQSRGESVVQGEERVVISNIGGVKVSIRDKGVYQFSEVGETLLSVLVGEAVAHRPRRGQTGE
jgi:hypothetical protein